MFLNGPVWRVEMAAVEFDSQTPGCAPTVIPT
jgi:hypothetical protein